MRPFFLFLLCALAGLAYPVPEDPVLLAAGMGVEGWTGFLALCVAGISGVFLRDSLFFGAGRLAGEGLLRRAFVIRWLGEDRIRASRERVRRLGGRTILFARFAIGVRTVGFLVAGAAGVRVGAFVFWDLLALLFLVPTVIAGGVFFAEPLQAGLTWLLTHRLLVVGLIGILVAGYVTRELGERSTSRRAQM